MKRAVVLIVMAMLLVPVVPAEAGSKSAKPRIRIVDITEVGPGDEGTTQYRITVEAVDPDGVVAEVAIDFGDGVMVWLLLICDEPGEPVVQEVTWSYQPGKYKVRAWGYSTEECFAGDVQESKVDKAKLKVR